MVSLEKMGRLEVPAILKLMEYRAMLTMIPESRSRTLSFTWIRPVTQPAAAPARKVRGITRIGSTPRTIRAAVTAMPRG